MADSMQNITENNCPGQWMSKEHKPALVSVIIPTYNRAGLVGRAIQSVLDQTYQNFEIITVDDASTDDTEKVVRNFEDSRIRYVRLNGNRGAPFARNYGVKIANGQYISLLDSDDYYLPDKLALQVEALRTDSDAGLVYSNILEERNNIKGRIRYDPKTFESGYLFENILLRNIHCRLPTWLIKRECFLSIGGFDEELPMLQDRDFIVRFSCRYKLLVVPLPVAVVVFHKDTRISNASAEVKEYACNRVLNKISRLVEEGNHSPVLIKKMTSLYSFLIGKAYLAEGNFPKARYYFLKALSSNPLNYKVYPYLISSVNRYLYYLMKKAKNISTKSFR